MALSKLRYEIHWRLIYCDSGYLAPLSRSTGVAVAEQGGVQIDAANRRITIDGRGQGWTEEQYRAVQEAFDWETFAALGWEVVDKGNGES